MINIKSVVNEWNGNVIDTTGEIISGGDLSKHVITIDENIFHETGGGYGQNSQNNAIYMPVQYLSEKKLIFPSFASLNGFLAGQSVLLEKFKQDGSILALVTSIVSIDYSTFTVEFANLFTPDSENENIYGITTNTGQQSQLRVSSYAIRNNFFFNLSFNIRPYPYLNNKLVSTSIGSYNDAVNENRKSPIDNTKIRFWAGVDTSLIAIGGSVTCQQLNNKSGITFASVVLKRLADVGTFTRQWELTIEMINPVHLLEDLNAEISQFFDERLIIYSDIEWYSSSNIVQYPSLQEHPTVVQHDLGFVSFFNDPYGLPASTLIQAVQGDLYYDGASDEKTIIINSPTIAQPQIGAGYIPINSDYFKNVNFDQKTLSMLIQTQDLAIATFTSEANPDNAQYQIQVTDWTYVANNHTIKFIMTPLSTEFEDFMINNDDGDRLFYIWIKCGNTCHLVFNTQLIKEPKIENLFDVYNHYPTEWAVISNNQTTTSYVIDNSFTGVYGVKPYVSTEDNILLTFQLKIPKFIRYEQFSAQIIFAKKTDLSEFFAFESFLIDLTDNNYDSVTGRTNFNENLGNNYNIQREIFRYIELKTVDLDIGNPSIEQGLRIRIPIQFNWRYWLTQVNVFDFLQGAGIQTKDFQEYEDYSVDYAFFIKCKLESETFVSTHYTPIFDILDYQEAYTTADEEWAGGPISVAYETVNGGVPTSNLIIGELMKVTFTVPTGLAVGSDYWGQITIEEHETNTRWAMSSNYDNNPINLDNPIIPIDGETRVKTDVTGLNEIQYSVLIDCSKLNGDDYDLAIKHFNKNVKVEQTRAKLSTSLSYFPTDLDIDESDVLSVDCCEIQNVFARLENNSMEFNDTSLLLCKAIPSLPAIAFRLYKDDVLVETLTTFSSINNNVDKYAIIKWQTILDIHGTGCYESRVLFNSLELIYGKYNLQAWTLDQVRNTVLINTEIGGKITYNPFAKYINDFWEFDFRNSKLLDSFRFQGFIGERDPKVVIDNIVTSDRNVNKVFKEYLNEYQLTTDPITKYFSRRLINLHLLNENQMFIWDYNEFNHEYYSNKRVVVKDVSKPDYKTFSNKAVVLAVLQDKILNNKSGF